MGISSLRALAWGRRRALGERSQSEPLTSYAYRIDSRDTIVWCSESWDDFAVANEAPEACGEAILGHSVWRYFEGLETRHLYRMCFNRVRSGLGDIVLPFRCDGPTTIRGVAHNRHKETDRIADLACELRRIGAHVIEHEDGLTIEPGAYHGADIETYNDHRMAMSLALAGLRVPGIRRSAALRRRRSPRRRGGTPASASCRRLRSWP